MTLPRLDAPLTFRPIFKERVWGGRRLAELYGKPLPDGPIGESWELVDREEDQSVVDAGPLTGATLHELWTDHREELFGAAGGACGDVRFPLLVKLLDARETLSLQVHPPAHVAPELGGEPKSEVWLITHATEDAHVYAGLRRGVTREQFERALRADGDLPQLLHRMPVEAGDALAVPSGRVHAIGAGNVLLEVQQCSDTTYRVYDFGRGRELHVDESLRCIDFDDVEPPLANGGDVLVDWEHFGLRRTSADAEVPEGEAAVVCVTGGTVRCGSATFGPGRTFVVGAHAGPRRTEGDGTIAIATLPTAPE